MIILSRPAGRTPDSIIEYQKRIRQLEAEISELRRRPRCVTIEEIRKPSVWPDGQSITMPLPSTYIIKIERDDIYRGTTIITEIVAEGAVSYSESEE